MVKNPAFRKLARDPNFSALAQNPVVLSALAANADALRRSRPIPRTFSALAQAAQQLSANNGSAANGVGTQVASALALNAELFQGVGLAADGARDTGAACAGVPAIRQSRCCASGNPAECGGVRPLWRRLGGVPADAANPSNGVMATEAKSFEALAADSKAMSALKADATSSRTLRRTRRGSKRSRHQMPSSMRRST